MCKLEVTHRNWLQCILLFSGLSTKNNKLKDLCDLCGSDERSEWAVSYRIKA